MRHYPNPFPNLFYSGNTNADAYIHTNRVPGLPGNYYAWEWGYALFVVLDASRYLPDAKPANLWDWTLGRAQYDWFKRTLETSAKPYKFVFAHHVLGQTRGGVAWADKFEWGGKNADGSWGFTANRPGWNMPIHQLMVSNKSPSSSRATTISPPAKSSMAWFTRKSPCLPTPPIMSATPTP